MIPSSTFCNQNITGRYWEFGFVSFYYLFFFYYFGLHYVSVVAHGIFLWGLSSCGMLA